eukprot:CAMPEP_0185782966 /NCGR_PEP_ID=MMETSP1174-20130828/113098_1 /TAXON_ID=35687 /ORGANISM="Dictyocha speculum, Strain CCMP1381" /LENGTH=35 /DNA_ID= /DNA_START= /DNA_END= /DNA_ORIENTATION=
MDAVITDEEFSFTVMMHGRSAAVAKAIYFWLPGTS